MIGNTVCYIHGGKSLSGIASPTYTNGRYSKVMPTQLMELHRQAQYDPNRLSIEADIELQDTLILSALNTMSRGDTGEMWDQLREETKAYKSALKNRKPNGPNPQDHLDTILWLIEQGYQDYMARKEVRQMLQERAKLVEGESRRLERAQQKFTADQAAMLARALLDAVVVHVRDRDALRGIQAEFNRLLSAPARTGTSASGDQQGL